MRNLLPITLITLVIMLAGCEVVGGIFKAGVWFGILIVVAVVALVIWLVTRGRR